VIFHLEKESHIPSAKANSSPSRASL